MEHFGPLHRDVGQFSYATTATVELTIRMVLMDIAPIVS